LRFAFRRFVLRAAGALRAALRFVAFFAAFRLVALRFTAIVYLRIIVREIVIRQFAKKVFNNLRADAPRAHFFDLKARFASFFDSILHFDDAYGADFRVETRSMRA
jgi:hypothetical protein